MEPQRAASHSLEAFEPSPEAVRARALQVAAARYGQGALMWRRPGVVAVLLALLTVYALLPAVPGAELLTTAPLWASVVAMGGQGVWLVACGWAMRHGVDSAIYRRLRVFDTSWWCLSACVLIALSETAASLYWFNLVMFIAIMLPNVVRHGFYRRVLFTGLVGLVATFAWRGDLAGTVLGTIVGASLLFIQALSTRLAGEAHTQQARAELAIEAAAALRASVERERIARELHDRVASDLTEVLWTASSIDDEEAQTLVASLQRCMVSLREVVLAARDEPMIASALGDRLTRAVDRLGDAAGIPVQVDVSAIRSDPIDASVAVTVLRVAQELVRNALTHSGSPSVRVVLNVDTSAVLTVSDEGCGLKDAPAGDGLSNIRLRVAEQGGSVCFDHPPGLTVTVIVPLTSATAMPSGAAAGADPRLAESAV